MIRILEKKVSDKIAAGEVIERPISIVKELIENSIDAGATAIVCEIKNGGKTYIRVTDNGTGIQAEDVEKAFLRHATSKISEVKDLNELVTLGFRGEALASIAAVSRVELLTKTKNSKTGTKLIVHGGEIVTNQLVGCPEGTTIVITDLFYNTPARQKFLKNDGAESNMIIEFMTQMSLAYKNIKFKMINNGKVLFTTNGNGDRSQIISQVYPEIDVKNLVKLNYQNDNLSLEGYISTPALSKNNKRNQIFFVNGRVVSSKVFDKGITEGYKERLFEGRHPVTFLFLNVKPNTLDVNIHPNKREVRFDDEKEISESISNAIKSTLGTKEAVVNASNIFKLKDNKSHKVENTKREKTGQNFQEEIKNYNEKVLGLDLENSKKSKEKEQVSIKQLLSTNNENERLKEEKNDSNFKPSGNILNIDEPINKPFDFHELQIIGTLFSTYILASDQDSFYMLDQHACHERVFYEKLVREYNNSSKSSQTILTPILINTKLSDVEDSYGPLGCLKNLGFSIEDFGNNSYRVTEIPAFMEISEAENFLNDYFDEIDDKTKFTNTVVVNKLITKSCKAAIKANDVISDKEITALIVQLSQCINPFSCPHGRPTFIKMTKYEIEKLFKRVQ